MTPIFKEKTIQGKTLPYAVIFNDENYDWGIHFSAFFGAWGDQDSSGQFRGYFHRLKMLGEYPGMNWLFLCDTYGAEKNGSYYWGEDGVPFVEALINKIWSEVKSEYKFKTVSKVLTIGSSMGATGAIKFGLQWDVDGVIAVSPHIDLEISARLQNREKHVNALLPKGQDFSSAEAHQITKQLQYLTQNDGKKPVLYLQACFDDKGVHPEQTLSFLRAWKRAGGKACFDLRPFGGHTSNWATRTLLIDVSKALLRGNIYKARLIRLRPSSWPNHKQIVAMARESVISTIRKLLDRYNLRQH